MKTLKYLLSFFLIFSVAYAAEIPKEIEEEEHPLAQVLKQVQFESLILFFHEIAQDDDNGLQKMAVASKEFKAIVRDYIKYGKNVAHLRWKHIPNQPKFTVIYGQLKHITPNTGCAIYICKDNMLILDMKRNKAYQFPADQYSCVELDPKGKFILAAPVDSKTIEKIDTISGKLISRWSTEEIIKEMVITAQANKLIGYSKTPENSRYIWDFNGKLFEELSESSISDSDADYDSSDEMNSQEDMNADEVSNSEDDMDVDEVSSSQDSLDDDYEPIVPRKRFELLGGGKLINKATGQIIQLDNDCYTSFTMSPDETYVISCRRDESLTDTIKVYESATGKLLKQWSYYCLDHGFDVYISDNSNVIYRTHRDQCRIFSISDALPQVLYMQETETAQTIRQKVQFHLMMRPINAILNIFAKLLGID